MAIVNGKYVSDGLPSTGADIAQKYFDTLANPDTTYTNPNTTQKRWSKEDFMPKTDPNQGSGYNFLNDLGKGMLGVGSSILDFGKMGLDTLGKIGNSSLALWNDLESGGSNAVKDVQNPDGHALLNDLAGVFSNIKNDVGNIWSSKDMDQQKGVVNQTFHNAYDGTPMGNKFMENAQYYGMPLFDPLAGSAYTGLARGASEVLGRIPGIAGKVNNFADKQAANAWEESQAAPNFDDLMKTEPQGIGGLPAVQGPRSSVNTAEEVGSQVPHGSGLPMNPNQSDSMMEQLAQEYGNTHIPQMDDSSVINMLSHGGEINPSLASQELETITHNPEIMNAGSSARSAATRNMMDGEWSDIEQGLSNQTGLVPKTYNPEYIPPNQLGGQVQPDRNMMEGEWSNIGQELSQQNGLVPKSYNGEYIPPNRMNGNVQQPKNILDAIYQDVGHTPLQPNSPVPFIHDAEYIPPNRVGGQTTPPRNIQEAEWSQAGQQGQLPGAVSQAALGAGQGQDQTNILNALATILHNPEVVNAGSSSRQAAQRMTQDAELVGNGGKTAEEATTSHQATHEAQAQAQADAEAAANTAREEAKAAGKTAQEAEKAAMSAKEKFIQDHLAKTTQGQKFQAYLRDALQRNVGARVSKAMFKAGFGSGLNLVPESLKNIFLNNRAEMDMNHSKIVDFFTKFAEELKTQGITKNDLWEMRNAFENGKPVDEKMQPILQMLLKGQNEGVAGVKAGLGAEQTAGMGAKELLDNYLHLSIDPKSMGRAERGIPKDAMSGISQNYNKSREFKTAANAEQAGYKVRDAVSSTMDRLMESNKDLMNNQLMKDLYTESLKTGKVSSAGKAGYKLFQAASKDNPFNGKMVDPYLHRLLKETERVPLAARQGGVGATLRGYDKMMNIYRTLGLYNPMVHNHNTITNALVSFGLHPKNYFMAENALGSKLGQKFEGKFNPDELQSMKDSIEWGKRTGAFGNEGKGDPFKQIERAFEGKDQKNAFQKFQDAGLWNREQALRAGVFHQARQDALGKGLSQEQAAHVARDVTNEHMADYSSHNLSKFEKEIAYRVDPFYKWHKSNYPLQVANMFKPGAIQRTLPVVKTRDALNQLLSGHPISQNVGEDKDRQYMVHSSLGGGKYLPIDMYLPIDEPYKMLNDPAGAFLWNRVNPYMKEVGLQATNHQFYPNTMVAPEGKLHMAETKITPESDSTTTAMEKRFAHAYNNMAPSLLKNVAQLLGINGQDPNEESLYTKTDPLTMMGLGALGTFPRETPASEVKTNITNNAEKRFLQRAKAQSRVQDRRN